MHNEEYESSNSSNTSNVSDLSDIDSMDIADVEFLIPTPPMKRPVSKDAVLSIVIGIVVIIGAIITINQVFSFFSPERVIERELKESNYSDIIEFVSEDDLQEIVFNEGQISIMQRDLSNIRDLFFSNKCSYNQAINKIDEIVQVGKGAIEYFARDMVDSMQEVRASREAFENGEKALTEKLYTTAISFFSQVIPEDIDAYSKAQQHIKNACSAYKNEQIERAESFISQKNYEEAISTLKTVYEYIPSDVDITTKISEITKEVNDIKIDETVIEIDRKYENGDPYDAITEIKDLIVSFGYDDRLVSLKSKYSDLYAEDVLKQVEKLEKKNKYEDAVVVLKTAVNVVPDNSLLNRKKAEVQDAYVEDILSQVEKLEKKKKYDDALMLLNNANGIVPGDSELLTELSEISAKRDEEKEKQYNNTRKEIITKANSKAKSEGWKAAIEFLGGIGDEYGEEFLNDTEISKLIEQFEANDYEETKQTILKKAEKKFKSKGWEEAVSYLKGVGKEYGEEYQNDEDIIKTIEEYEQYKNVLLSDIVKKGEFFDGSVPKDSLFINRYLTDNYKNTYKSSVGIAGGHSSTRFKLLIKDLGYKTVSGTIALPEGTKPSYVSGEIMIYVDGACVFDCNWEHIDAKPRYFSIDVSGAEVIEFRYYSFFFDNDTYRTDGRFMTIFDGQFSK